MQPDFLSIRFRFLVAAFIALFFFIGAARFCVKKIVRYHNNKTITSGRVSTIDGSKTQRSVDAFDSSLSRSERYLKRNRQSLLAVNTRT